LANAVEVDDAGRLECFQAKWKPVRVKKTRQIRNLEPRFDSIEAEKALDVGAINKLFRDAGGSYEEYRVAVKAAIAHGWITMQPSGGYLSFTQAGADLFAKVGTLPFDSSVSARHL
jgi:hypothetical protein